MRVLILGAESLGARSMATVVETADRTVLIDPGVALGRFRFRLPPHPDEAAAAARIRESILRHLPRTTDIVFTHYHGDHVPLKDPDCHQIALDDFTPPEGVVVHAKGPDGISRTSAQRRSDLENALGRGFPNAEGTDDGVVACSPPVPHGSSGGSVMMTAVREGEACFVHASDIQCTSPDAIGVVAGWHPSLVFVSGPPLYLHSFTREQEENAFSNALHLARSCTCLVIDHHLLRSMVGDRWMKGLRKATACRILSAAEFMGEEPRLLEAMRAELWACGIPP
ncbi:MBL fold metallo-hydrolase [Methanofollis fontis]|nr:MBL fold metallo-hydrolase [Methanofollis fontis]